MTIYARYIFVITVILPLSIRLYSQAVPTTEENIPYMITFGNSAEKTWGDDDFCQVFFYMVPKLSSTPFYVRVFDPDTGGEIDEARGDFNTKIKFSVYGGTGCFSHKDSKNVDPKGEYKSGNLISSKIFGIDSKYDNQWYSFGPINPAEGEYVKQFDSYLFKIIAEGIEGNDGNLYKYYFSSSSGSNTLVEGGSTFTYEYSFRLSDQVNHKSHIYPFVDDKVITIKINLFDWDNDGKIRLVSKSNNGKSILLSGDGKWVVNTVDVTSDEKNSTFDIQFIKPTADAMKNNNGVVYITNQYNEALPFYTTPIGGAPKYNYKINVVKDK